jgi:hypothetical protein
LDRALSKLSEAAKTKQEARTQKLEEQVQKKDEKTRKKEEKIRKKEEKTRKKGLDPALSELAKEAETKQAAQAKIQKNEDPALNKSSKQAESPKEKKSHYLDAIAFVQQRIEKIKKNLTTTSKIPVIGLRSCILPSTAASSPGETSKSVTGLHDLKPIAKIPEYCKEENCVKYAETLGMLNKHISKLEREIARTTNNDFKETAEKHLIELKELKTKLLDDKPITIPDYGIDITTQKKNNVMGYVLKLASAETTRKSNQGTRSPDATTIVD